MTVLDVFQKWYKRYLFEEEAILLLVLLTISIALLMTIGDILAPLLASIVLAYLMQGLSSRLERLGLPQWVGVSVAYVVFVGAFFAVSLGILPLAWRQLVSLVSELPRMLEHGRQLLSVLPAQYPDYITADQLNNYVSVAQRELATFGQTLLTRTVASIPGILTVMVYMVLIPILVFFFLKDRELILNWLAGFLPRERPLLTKIWVEMNVQFANYARGKVVEVIVVGAVSYFAFASLGLKY